MLTSETTGFLLPPRDQGVVALASRPATQPAARRVTAWPPPGPGLANSAGSGRTAGPSRLGAAAGGCLCLAGAVGSSGLARRGRRVGTAQAKRKAVLGDALRKEAAGAPSQAAQPRAAAGAPEAAQKKQPKLQFASGDSLTSARRLAESRKFVVAPWNKDVQTRPIIALADDCGTVAKNIVKAGFTQFGKLQKLRMSVRSQVLTQKEVDEILQTAVGLKGGPALVVYTLDDEELDEYLRAEASRLEVPHVNAMEGPLGALRRRFGAPAGAGRQDEGERWMDAVLDEDPTVFVVSDTTGDLAGLATRAALERLSAPSSALVDTMTVCPEVTSLEEVTLIAQRAFATGSVVIFSFASPGLSRYMRMQCERLKVVYADLLQPVLVSMEQYLEYPFVGVPGGLELGSIDDASARWTVHEV
mmetsp:Transcript_36167/g.91017  ORF Transcript_36167/g.91017 Transcript_36167/m.91017 type:complete len:416 (+) Transcript_36167:59-1306(+)